MTASPGASAIVNALEEFRALGIDFVSLHEGVDTSTPNGRLVFGIFGSLSNRGRSVAKAVARNATAPRDAVPELLVSLVSASSPRIAIQLVI